MKATKCVTVWECVPFADAAREKILADASLSVVHGYSILWKKMCQKKKGERRIKKWNKNYIERNKFVKQVNQIKKNQEHAW